jgi:hypothetical protein
MAKEKAVKAEVKKSGLKSLPKKTTVAATRRLAANHNETLLRG